MRVRTALTISLLTAACAGGVNRGSPAAQPVRCAGIALYTGSGATLAVTASVSIRHLAADQVSALLLNGVLYAEYWFGEQTFFVPACDEEYRRSLAGVLAEIDSSAFVASLDAPSDGFSRLARWRLRAAAGETVSTPHRAAIMAEMNALLSDRTVSTRRRFVGAMWGYLTLAGAAPRDLESELAQVRAILDLRLAEPMELLVVNRGASVLMALHRNAEAAQLLADALAVHADADRWKTFALCKSQLESLKGR